MAKPSLAKRIVSAMAKRVHDNTKRGCVQVVTLTISSEELYSLLGVQRLHNTTLNGVAAKLTQWGYQATWTVKTGLLVVSYDPAQDFLNFNSLEALEHSNEQVFEDE